MRTEGLISEWETSDDLWTRRVYLASDIVLSFSGPTGAIGSSHQANILCESTSPLVLLLS